MNRRSFLATSVAGFLARHARGAGCSPNGKLHHACIGVANMGRADLNSLKTHPRIEIVALCDVDKDLLTEAAALVPNARTYTDWRELFAKEGDRIDSVNVSVPDHMHAVIAIAAVQARKHVYCQKPLCHDVVECRELARAVEGSGLVTQLGTQLAAEPGNRMTVRLLRDNAVGVVKRVVLCSTRKTPSRLEGPRPSGSSPVPPNLNWDHWLGTAPERPYAPGVYHPRFWRAWQDFGTGWVGDMGCHLLDPVWKGLELTAPLSVTAEVQESWKDSPLRRAENWPQSEHVTWVLPGNAKSGGEEFTMEWFDGPMLPPEDVRALAAEAGLEQYPEEASLVIGAEGALLMPHGAAPSLLPKKKFESYPKPRLSTHPSHYHHFVDTCLGGGKTESDFIRTGPMTEAILLGSVALRVPDTLLKWDAQQLRISNSAEAHRLLRRTYRTGW